MPMAYRYRPEVLEALARHGVAPLDGTPPSRVREHLNDLYRYEIRRLRARLLRGKYLLLSMPVGEWAVELPSGG